MMEWFELIFGWMYMGKRKDNKRNVHGGRQTGDRALSARGEEAVGMQGSEQTAASKTPVGKPKEPPQIQENRQAASRNTLPVSDEAVAGTKGSEPTAANKAALLAKPKEPPIQESKETVSDNMLSASGEAAISAQGGEQKAASKAALVDKPRESPIQDGRQTVARETLTPKNKKTAGAQGEKQTATSKTSTTADSGMARNATASTVEAKTDNAEKDAGALPLPAEKKAETVYLRNNGQWQGMFEAVVGTAHRKVNPPLPCQDAAICVTNPRSVIITADGAGSAAVSEIGSKAVVHGIRRLLATLEHQLAGFLDVEKDTEALERESRKWAYLIVTHAKGILTDLALENRRPVCDFRCTLLAAVVGKKHVLWVKVGDGALVIEKMPAGGSAQLHALGLVGKGEYANQTTFIDEKVRAEDVQYGLEDGQCVSALFAMSDGAAERFVSSNGSKVAQRLANWAQELRDGKLSRQQLTVAFYGDDFRKGHSGDDCSLAMLAAGVVSDVESAKVPARNRLPD